MTDCSGLGLGWVGGWAWTLGVLGGVGESFFAVENRVERFNVDAFFSGFFSLFGSRRV